MRQLELQEIVGEMMEEVTKVMASVKRGRVPKLNIGKEG